MRPSERTIVLLALILMAAAVAAPAPGEDKAQATSPACRLRAADLAALAGRFGRFSDDLPPAAQLGVKKILAYEENRHFVYVRGAGPSGDRRIVFCKPATFVVDDRPAAAGSPWRLVCGKAAKIAAGRFAAGEGDAVLTGQVLLPAGGLVKAARTASGGRLVETVGKGAGDGRFIHVIHVGTQGAEAPKATVAEKDGTATLKLTAGDRTFTLVLPAEVENPGSIAVAQAGKAVLAQRLLPAGVMPHGANGVRMLERWDSSYRRTRMPGWDVGRAASELKKIVENGTIRPGRALVLGCGTGTNAIYLASKGFKVTGVEVAPTALTLADRRARKAKVRVRWLVADVAALPEIGPFDLIFDRGCYHHVQRYNAAGFVKSVDRLSRAGAHFLLLAGNANQPRHGGPPRVEETQLVNDFAKTWDFVSLREIRFESRDPNNKRGPWAWSALLRRRAPKK